MVLVSRKHTLKHRPKPQPKVIISNWEFCASESSNTYPRESMELHLVLLSELPMHRGESGLLSCEFLVEVANVAGRFLDARVK